GGPSAFRSARTGSSCRTSKPRVFAAKRLSREPNARRARYLKQDSPFLERWLMSHGAATAAWPFADSDMAQLMRSHDWAATPLGPVEGWSERLRGLVDLMLSSGTMMCLMWSPGAHLIYNEPYARSIDGQHPGALG